MKAVTIVLALIAGVGTAAAQSPPNSNLSNDKIEHPTPQIHQSVDLQLTTAQKAKILDAVRRDGRSVAPLRFSASVGASVPPSIELHLLPDGVLGDVPETKLVKYTVVDHTIVLVDPTTMRVVEVLNK